LYSEAKVALLNFERVAVIAVSPAAHQHAIVLGRIKDKLAVAAAGATPVAASGQLFARQSPAPVY
jgi:hypothetical protein